VRVFAVVPLLCGLQLAVPPHVRGIVEVSVHTLGGPDDATMRVVVSGGKLRNTSNWITLVDGGDTLRVTGIAHVVLTDETATATFLSDKPGQQLVAETEQDGKPVSSGVGSTILVQRRPGQPTVLLAGDLDAVTKRP
jgi:hypothetical protein